MAEGRKGRKLLRNVVVTNPDTRETVALPEGSTLPGWAEPLVTNPLAFTAPDDTEAPLPYAPLSDESIEQMAARMSNDDLERLRTAIAANESARVEADRSDQAAREATTAQAAAVGEYVSEQSGTANPEGGTPEGTETASGRRTRGANSGG